MSDQERIEEAHGLWELAVTRVAALAEAMASIGQPVPDALLHDAVSKEREAFAHWQRISNAVTERRA